MLLEQFRSSLAYILVCCARSGFVLLFLVTPGMYEKRGGPIVFKNMPKNHQHAPLKLSHVEAYPEESVPILETKIAYLRRVINILMKISKRPHHQPLANEVRHQNKLKSCFAIFMW